MMNTAILQHTPGPWECHGKYPSARVIAGGFEILVTKPGEGAQVSEWLANCRLIAAAPDLLAALKQIEAYALLNRADPRAPTDSQLAVIRNAIQKAEIL